MEKFSNVNVKKSANIYFDGKVTSRTIEFADGSIKTLGIMLPGEYEFGTGAPELMEIYSGQMQVKLPNSSVWRTIKGGESFDVEGNAKFQLKVTELSDYCCSFIEA